MTSVLSRCDAVFNFASYGDYPLEEPIPPLEYPVPPIDFAMFADQEPMIGASVDNDLKKFYMGIGGIIDHYVMPGERNNIKFHFGRQRWVFETLVHWLVQDEYYKRIGMTRDEIFAASGLENHMPMPSCDKCQTVYTSAAAGQFERYHCDCHPHHTICGYCRKQKQFARYKCPECHIKLHQRTPSRYRREAARREAARLRCMNARPPM